MSWIGMNVGCCLMQSPSRFSSFVFLIYVAGHMTTKYGLDVARGPDILHHLTSEQSNFCGNVSQMFS